MTAWWLKIGRGDWRKLFVPNSTHYIKLFHWIIQSCTTRHLVFNDLNLVGERKKSGWLSHKKPVRNGRNRAKKPILHKSDRRAKEPARQCHLTKIKTSISKSTEPPKTHKPTNKIISHKNSYNDVSSNLQSPLVSTTLFCLGSLQEMHHPGAIRCRW